MSTKKAPAAVQDNMLENPKVLAAMSERAFAEMYSRLMKLAKPLVKIKGGDARKPYIDRLIAQMKSDNTDAAAKRAAAAEERAKNPPPAAEAKQPAAAKPAKEKKAPKEPKAPGEKKRARREPPAAVAACDAANPFRAGTCKHDGFNVYKKGGAWAGILGQIQALGVKEATAENWMTYSFKRVAEGGPAQVNRRKEAKAAASPTPTEIPGAAVPAK